MNNSNSKNRISQDSSSSGNSSNNNNDDVVNGKVKHDYHDHADDVIPPGPARGGSSGDQQTFPVKLHYVLAEIEKDGLSHLISWQSHGRCFVVHNQRGFVEHILGSWFQMKNYSSFQRQLNLYGFKRLSTGTDRGGYYHELFLRQRPHLALHIRRFKVKGKGMRKPASPESEPDFYAMRALPPNPCHQAPPTQCQQQVLSSTAAATTAATKTAADSHQSAPAPMLQSREMRLQSLLPTAFSSQHNHHQHYPRMVTMSSVQPLSVLAALLPQAAVLHRQDAATTSVASVPSSYHIPAGAGTSGASIPTTSIRDLTELAQHPELLHQLLQASQHRTSNSSNQGGGGRAVDDRMTLFALLQLVNQSPNV